MHPISKNTISLTSEIVCSYMRVFTVHHIHKLPPCNFERFKMPSTKETIEYQERSCQVESLGVVLGSCSHLTRRYRLLNSG